MNLKTIGAAVLALALVVPFPASRATAEVQFPKAGQSNADEKTIAEFQAFYDRIEEALKAEDIDRLMSFYAEDYLHHGITKKQLKFMWLEILSTYADLYSVHVFTKITVAGNDAILVCTGALFGIETEGGDYQTVDRWVTQNHWLTKVGGDWKMIGGAAHQGPAGRGGKLELHPLF
jgi:ketosteroid isomerase-like protein